MEAGNKRGFATGGSRATKVGMTKTNNPLNDPATTLAASIRHVGLDVHKDTIAVAVAEGIAEPYFLKRISHDLHAVGELREGGEYQLRMCYEAGPTGFVLARRLQAWGIECLVISPSHVPKGSADKVKTDKRDALKLARLLRSGDLKSIHLPDERDEAVRDLCRARTDAVEDLRRVRQQLKAFLLRNGYRYSGKSSWTQGHLRYLRELVMGHPAQKLVLEETLQAIDRGVHRVAQLEAHLETVVSEWRMRPVVEALQCLRGVAFIAASVLVSELGDLSRFAQPRQLMAFLGLVTNENSTGTKRRQGAITKCGNGHARMFLIEAAHHYRLPPKISKELSRAPGETSPQNPANLLDRAKPPLPPHLEAHEPRPQHSENRRRCGPRTQRIHLAVFRECRQPGCVDIRTPRPIPSPNHAARKVHYILHPVTSR